MNTELQNIEYWVHVSWQAYFYPSITISETILNCQTRIIFTEILLIFPEWFQLILVYFVTLETLYTLYSWGYFLTQQRQFLILPELLFIFAVSFFKGEIYFQKQLLILSIWYHELKLLNLVFFIRKLLKRKMN